MKKAYVFPGQGAQCVGMGEDSFIKDIQMIFCTVLGKNMEYAGERI